MKTATAQGILSKLCKLKTIYRLVVFSKVLGITEELHRYLQGENVDLGKAAQYKTAITETDLRTNSGAEDMFKSAMTLCAENDIQLPAGPRHKQKRLDDFVEESACGATPDPITSGDF